MKIALVDDTIYGYASGDASAVGGAERYMWLQTRALVAAGWSAVVGTWSALPPGERRRIDGVEFVGVERGNTARVVAQFLRSERPDWCHWFGASPTIGPALLMGKLTGTRGIFSAQFDLDVRPSQALYRRRHLWPLYAAGLWSSDRIFVQHGGQYAGLASSLRRKAHVIPGVVELPRACKRHAARDAYVAWVGVLRQPKRPDLLLEIARRLPHVDFVVCGGGSDHRTPPGYSDRIVDEFRRVPNIRYLGHIAPAAAIDVIANASILLSTSDGEGFPSVFLEAWANGTPVVSLTIDPDGAIATHRLGLVSGNVAAATPHLAALVRSSDRRQLIADRCREYVARVHSAAAAAAAVERALSDSAAPMLQPFSNVGES
jgi:glycosyltransferase involved in cell wall biosynthesis